MTNQPESLPRAASKRENIVHCAMGAAALGAVIGLGIDNMTILAPLAGAAFGSLFGAVAGNLMSRAARQASLETAARNP